jgi:hypothetical protein
MTAIMDWDAFDGPSTPDFRRPGDNVAKPMWAPQVDPTEHEDPGVVIELAGSDRRRFGRPLSLVQRLVDDAVDTACEGGAPRTVGPGSTARGSIGH